MLIVLIGAAAWVGTRGLQAKAELEAAQSQIGTLKSQALAFDIAGAKSTLAQVRKHTAEAANLTGDPVWRAAEFVPFAGPNLSAVRELAEITDTIISDVAHPLLQVAAPLNPEKLLAGGASIDPKPIIDAIPAVTSANEAAQSALKHVRSLNTEGTLPQLVAARAKIADLLDSVAPTLKIASDTLTLVPGFLGVDSPRTYVVMFQNNAELRSLGGTALSFAELRVDNGQLELAATVSAGSNNFPGFPTSPIPLPDGAADIYTDNTFGTIIANATLRPDFATAGALVAENWKAFRNGSIDGVISVDPVALSYFLRGTEPISIPSGDIITSDNLVPLVLNELYLRFNSGTASDDNVQQDLVYDQIVNATFNRLTSGALPPKSVLAASTQAISERRLMFWSADEAVQSRLVQYGLAGGLPMSDASVTRAGVYVEDAVGSKLNYYLSQQITHSSAQCSPGNTVENKVTLHLQSSVPDIVVDDNVTTILGAWRRENIEPGHQRLNVMLYAPPGATITKVSVDGVEQDLPELHDEAYQVSKLRVTIEPGGQREVGFAFVGASGSPSSLAIDFTPLAHATTVSEEALLCGANQ